MRGVTFAFLCSAAVGVAFSADWRGGSPVGLTNLASKADLIVVARIERATSDASRAMFADLAPVRVIQGQPVAAPIQVILPASATMAAGDTFSRVQNLNGVTALWFLRKDGTGSYSILPLLEGEYTEQYSYLPVSEADLPESRGSVGRQILDIAAAWHRRLPEPSMFDDSRLLGSIMKADPADGLAFAASLIESAPTSRLRVIGYCAALRLGSEDALKAIGKDLDALKTDSMFRLVTDALTNYKPQGGWSIDSLRHILEMRSDIPGLDYAAATALQGIGKKDVLPVLVLAFDSRDPQAVLRAAWFFGYFAHFADAKGNLHDWLGPYYSETTHRYMPRRDSGITPTEYAEFWKEWWAQNKAALGFAGQ